MQWAESPWQALSLVISAAAILFLLGLGVAAFFHAGRVTRFLLAFASSARLHLVEMAIRIVVGAALVTAAAETSSPRTLSAFGWTLILSSAVLLALPWRLHRSIAGRMAPLFVDHVRWIGAGSLLLGGLLAAALFND